MSNVGAALGAAVPVPNARAAASRRNGAKSRGPKTPEGKARSAQNALKHGMRALRYVVLPDEDGVEFQALENALLEELAPVGALQLVLARRVAMAAWRLARADRMEVELFEERRWDNGGVGMALIRDGNGTRSFETLMRYRGAAMAEFWRALKTLKALQAEARADAAAAVEVPELPAAPPALVDVPRPPAARPKIAHPSGPNEPERRPDAGPVRGLEYVLPDPSGPGRTLHEPAAPWMPNEPETGRNEREPSCSLQEEAPQRPNEFESCKKAEDRQSAKGCHGNAPHGSKRCGSDGWHD